MSIGTTCCCAVTGRLCSLCQGGVAPESLTLTMSGFTLYTPPVITFVGPGEPGIITDAANWLNGVHTLSMVAGTGCPDYTDTYTDALGTMEILATFSTVGPSQARVSGWIRHPNATWKDNSLSFISWSSTFASPMDCTGFWSGNFSGASFNPIPGRYHLDHRAATFALEP